MPPRSLTYGVAAALVLTAFVGVGMGLRASWREAGAPDLAGGAASVDDADTVTAKPIVELPPPPTAPDTAQNQAADQAASDNKADAIDEKTAEAQQIQSTTAKGGGDIDQILASPSEKPTAPSKSNAAEPPPPGPPVKSDVPF